MVEVPRRPVSLLEPIVGGERYLRLVETADQVRRQLAGRTIWNVNSTATGGGVAEMLQVLVGYINDLDIPAVTGPVEHWLEDEERWDDEPPGETWEEEELEHGH